VTPGKLSTSAEAVLAVPTGPKGDPVGTAHPGQRVLKGLPGTTGNESLGVDGVGKVPDLRTIITIPLTGATSWTSTAGEFGLRRLRHGLRQWHLVARIGGLDLSGSIRRKFPEPDADPDRPRRTR
jgi:hypothetical protein